MTKRDKLTGRLRGYEKDGCRWCASGRQETETGHHQAYEYLQKLIREGVIVFCPFCKRYIEKEKRSEWGARLSANK